MSKQDDLLIKHFEVIFASALRSRASGSTFHGKFQNGQAPYIANQTYGEAREAVIIPVKDLKALLLKAGETGLHSELEKAQKSADTLRGEKNKVRLAKIAESFSKKYGKQR